LVDERLRLAQDIDLSSHAPVNFTELSTQTEGYSITDLKDLVSRAIHQVAMRAVAKPSNKVRKQRMQAGFGVSDLISSSNSPRQIL
jgi:peroxin-1